MSDKCYTRDFKVIPWETVLICTDCDKEMEFTGKSLMSCPPQYEHRCSGCSYTENKPVIHPFIDYVKSRD